MIMYTPDGVAEEVEEFVPDELEEFGALIPEDLNDDPEFHGDLFLLEFQQDLLQQTLTK